MRDNAEFLAGIGSRVRELRIGGGYSLDALAATTDMSKAGIWQIEKGRSEPGAGTLYRLSIALQCTADYLLRGE